jgi:predicted histone-like DNA-binding protein
MKKENALHYGIFRSPMKDKDGNNIYYVRARSLQRTIPFKTVCEDIQQNSSPKISDVKGVTAALAEEIATQLSNNNRVHIDGLGYFSLRMRLDKKKNVTDSQDIRASDIKISGISFQPEKSFIEQCAGSNTTYEVATRSITNVPDEGTWRKTLSTYFQSHPFITIRELADLLGISYKVAREKLLAMSSGPFPRLHSRRVGRQLLFSPV